MQFLNQVNLQQKTNHSPRSSDCLRLVHLNELMAKTEGSPKTVIGLVDGPIVAHHPDLMGASLNILSTNSEAICSSTDNSACRHGTLIAGILSAKRGSAAPAIAPGCTLLVRSLFTEADTLDGQAPRASAEQLASAIQDCITAGAQILNLSVVVMQASQQGKRDLDLVLNHAMSKRILVVVAAGNQGNVGGSPLVSHPWTIPVVAYDNQKRLLSYSNLARSIGQRGIGGPGQDVYSLSSDSNHLRIQGTSAATAFISGTLALLRSLFPKASTLDLHQSLLASRKARQTSIVPPLLNAQAAYEFLYKLHAT